MNTYEDLLFWQKAHQLVLEIYNETKFFPDSEKFGITNQLRRCASSVPANIAEGYSRKSNIEKQRFLNIAIGSLEECRYFMLLSNDLKYLKNYPKLNQKAIEVRKMILAYSSKLN